MKLLSWGLRSSARRLDGKTVRRDFRLRAGRPNFWIGKRYPLGHEDLRFDDVDPGDFFGHSMFDLDARIDFDEVKLVGIAVELKLNGTRVGVVH